MYIAKKIKSFILYCGHVQQLIERTLAYSVKVAISASYYLYRTEGNFSGGKIWRICCKTHIGGIKFAKFSHPQTENYPAKLQRNS